MPICNTQAEFIDFLKGLNAAGDIMLTAKTPVIMRKKGNPYKGAVKVQAVKVAINEDYQGQVNHRRFMEDKAVDFVAEGLKWGTCDDNIIVEHKGKTYVKTILLTPDREALYMVDNRIITYDDLKPFLRVPTASKKQRLDQEVKVRTFTVDNVVAATIGDLILYSNPNAEL